MTSASLDLRRRVLCGRANAERVATRISAKTGKSHAVVRTGNMLQPFCVMPTGENPPGAIELQVAVL
jgi:hypothetical protein